MTLRYPSTDARPMIDPRLVRQMIATTLAGVLLYMSASFAGADTLAPSVDTGGSGSGSVDITDMLRGDYSPVAVTEEIAVTDVKTPISVADMLRGDYSPVGATQEIAVTDVQGSVDIVEMLRGDQSPIATDVV